MFAETERAFQELREGTQRQKAIKGDVLAGHVYREMLRVMEGTVV